MSEAVSVEAEAVLLPHPVSVISRSDMDRRMANVFFMDQSLLFIA
jgi:hypothetical protein